MEGRLAGARDMPGILTSGRAELGQGPVNLRNHGLEVQKSFFS